MDDRVDGFGSIGYGDEIAASATSEATTEYFDHPAAVLRHAFRPIPAMIHHIV